MNLSMNVKSNRLAFSLELIPSPGNSQLLEATNTGRGSPAGRYVILAGLKGSNGQLEFYDVDELETMATAEHFMATDIEWDPTGRYVATAVTSVHEMVFPEVFDL